MPPYTRGELEEIQAGVYSPAIVTTTFDGTGNNGKVSTAAALTTSLTGTNNDIVYTADTAGLAGNNITVEYSSTNLQPGQTEAVAHTSGTTIVVDLKTSAGVKATATLTSSGVFQNTETVTIDETEYTFVTALSTGPTVAYEVLIGASAAASLDNLKSAVNLTAGIGTTYSTGTAIHPTVTATTNDDTTQIFEAKTLGTAGNSIATTETTANNAFGDTVMAGGEDVNQVLSTADEVKTAIEADTAAAALVGVADAGGNDGSGVVTVMTATSLTGGSDGTVSLFTIRQDGLVAILGDCNVDLTGATATLEVGITGDTAALIPQTTATTLDAGERIDRTGVISTSTAPNVGPFFPVRVGDVIKVTVGTATITAGSVDWQLFYSSFNIEGDSVLPAGAPLADSTANPTVSGIGAYNMVYNGLWHRQRGDDGGTYVQGTIDHDVADTGRPIKLGGKASAAAPADVSADNDRVNAWFIRNGAQATVLTAGGALIGGDATNGLDVDVTRIIPGTSATHLGKAVDSAAGATDTGVASLVVRDDALTTLTPVDGDFTFERVDSTGAKWVRETQAPAYEDNTNAKAVVEHRYTPSYKLTADTLVKTGAGLVHNVTFTCNDAAPTAGSIIIYDNTAESGSELFNHTFTTTPFTPFTVTLNASFATGLYVGFTTTADVNVFVSYR